MSFDNCICTVDCPLTEDKHYINCPAHTYYNEAYFRPATALEASSRQEEGLRQAIDHLDQAAFLATNHGGWFEGDPWEWAQDIAKETAKARAALEPPHAKDAADV